MHVLADGELHIQKGWKHTLPSPMLALRVGTGDVFSPTYGMGVSAFWG